MINVSLMITLSEQEQFIIELTKRIFFSDKNYFRFHHSLRQRNNKVTLKHEQEK